MRSMDRMDLVQFSLILLAVFGLMLGALMSIVGSGSN
jgi:hypothetical protein